VDIERMRRSFDMVAVNGDEVPLYFYSHLFLSHPETRRMFPVSMMHQRDRLLAALVHVVSKVDDLDNLVPVLQQLGRDHRKFGALAEHYPAVGESLVATLAHFAGDAWTPEVAADWAAAYGLVAQVMVEAAAEASGAPPWWDAKVVAHERRTIDVAVIRVQPESRLDYEPGQSVSIETELRPRLWRYYSVACAPREDTTLDFHVQARDGGPVSSALVRNVTAGDILRLGPPVGQLVLEPDSDRDLLMVAGGTGIAPMKALIEQVARLDVPRRVDLFLGAPSVRRLYDIEDLKRLADQHAWLTLRVAVSDDETYDGDTGSVVDLVASQGPWASRDVYVCGSPPMVGATVARLTETGVPQRRIRTEEFTPSRPGPSVDGTVRS
jgi:NAD(P)H-flavin reductase/hemoglobin-like flavoprotein